MRSVTRRGVPAANFGTEPPDRLHYRRLGRRGAAPVLVRLVRADSGSRADASARAHAAGH